MEENKDGGANAQAAQEDDKKACRHKTVRITIPTPGGQSGNNRFHELLKRRGWDFSEKPSSIPAANKCWLCEVEESEAHGQSCDELPYYAPPGWPSE